MFFESRGGGTEARRGIRQEGIPCYLQCLDQLGLGRAFVADREHLHPGKVEMTCLPATPEVGNGVSGWLNK